MRSRIRHETVARRHRDFWQRRGVDDGVFRDELVGVKQERREAVHLRVGERTRRVGGHRAADVVEDRSGIRPVVADRVRQRGILRERETIAGLAPDEYIVWPFLAGLAVTARASRREDRGAL